MDTSNVQHTADSKRCPMCAENVKAGAVICRFCGYNFGTGQMMTTAAEPERRKADVPFNGLAVTALVLGLAGTIAWLPILFVLSFLLDGYWDRGEITIWGVVSLVIPILAVVFGALALRSIQLSHGGQRGRGLAIAGWVLGIVMMVLYLILILWGWATRF